MANEYRLHLLGGFRLERISVPERDAARVQLYSRKVESLLAYLALYPQEHAREKIAALLWGDSSDEQARGSLRRALNNLRQQLGSESILADRETVQLNADFRLWTDAAAFSQMANPVSQELNADSIGDRRFAISDYAELLPDFYDDWLETPREELRALFLDTSLKLIEHARANSEYKTAVELAQKILTVDKANEAAHQHLMFCYSALGDRAGALDQYEFCKRALKEELGIEPSQETRALYKLILSQTETNSVAARLTNLPRPTTSFIGREKEIGEIRELIPHHKRGESSSLITLTGPGGSGKTRLAIQVGHEVVKEFPDGVWWVDLSALQDEGFMPNHMAKALGIPEQPNVPVLETLRESLRTKQLLLVLDNCEHLTKGAARLVAALVSTCPLSILATSRVRLNVPGELTYPVSTLATPTQADAKLPPSELLAFEAVKLFAARARLHQTIFRLNEQNALHVVRICQQLDGIPLALELAAAQISTLSLDEIAARLGQRRELVDATRAHSRRQTLHALISWSYELLTPIEQVLFRRLAVFAGGWTLEQAIVVAGGYASADAQLTSVDANNELPLPVTASFAVNALLDNLVSKSLVLVEKERYHFLETIREYAREKLEAVGESDVLEAQHYGYFTRLAETAEPHLRGKGQIEWGERLETEHPNLSAALHWALAQPNGDAALRLVGPLRLYFVQNGRISDGKDWYDKTLAMRDASANVHYLAKAYSGAGAIAREQGDLTKAFSLHSQALRCFEQVQDQDGVALSLHSLAQQRTWQGNYDEAESLIQRALATARENNVNWLLPRALSLSGVILVMKGDYKSAVRQYEEALTLARVNGDTNTMSVILHNLGGIESAEGNYTRAMTLLSESLHLAQAQQALPLLVANLAEQGLVYLRQGEYPAAIEVTQRGAKMAVDASMQELVARSVQWQAAAHGYLGQFEHAVKLWGAIVELREKIGAPLDPMDSAEYEKAVSYVSEQIGAERFAELLAKGRGMSADQVRELILS